MNTYFTENAVLAAVMRVPPLKAQPIEPIASAIS